MFKGKVRWFEAGKGYGFIDRMPQSWRGRAE
jgi:cold shock CspA family protein